MMHWPTPPAIKTLLDTARGRSLKMRRVVGSVTDTARRHGWPRALVDVAWKATNAVVPIKILRGVAIEQADPAFLDCPPGYTSMFLTAKMLRKLARDPQTGVHERFVEQALAGWHQCFGIFDGDTLASYGWYSPWPTCIDPPELVLRFSADYVYMYNGYTHPRYRGQRLHAIGMSLALRYYLAKGFKGLVSYVEANNFDSLKSVARMGYVRFGSVYIMKVAGRYLGCASRGCRRFGFRVEPVNSADGNRQRRKWSSNKAASGE